MNEHEILELLASEPVKTSSLKRMLVNTRHCTNMRSADRTVARWLAAGVLKKVSFEVKGFRVIYCNYYEAYELERLNSLRHNHIPAREETPVEDGRR